MQWEATSEVAASDALAAQQKVCASNTFAKAPRLRAFLKLIVTRTANGQSHLIKAYSIGVDALERPADFDPDKQSIVRVEALRLRSALNTYYDTEGSGDPVRIRLPPGSYVPIFAYRSRTASSHGGAAFQAPGYLKKAYNPTPTVRPLSWLQAAGLVIGTAISLIFLELQFGISGPLHAAFDPFFMR